MFDLNKNNWPEFQFSEIAEQISERIDPAESDAEVYVGLEHIEPNSIHIKEYGKPSDVKGTKLKVYKGDIIFGKRRAYQRKAAIANFDGICSAHAMVLRAKPKIMIPELFPFFLHSDAFMNRAIDISEGSLSPTIKWKILAKQKFTIPPLDDQRKLADLLWAGNRTSRNYLNLINKLKKKFNTDLNGLIPKPKEYEKINNRIKVHKGLTYKSSDYSEKNNGIPMVNLKCFERYGGFNSKGIKYFKGNFQKKHTLKEDDLIIALTDITRDAAVVGYPVFAPNLGKDVVFTMDTAKLEIKDNEISPKFLYYLLRTHWAHWHMYAYSSGTTVLHLDLISIPKLNFPKIDLSEQKLIVSKLEKTESLINYAYSLKNKCNMVIKCLISDIF